MLQSPTSSPAPEPSYRSPFLIALVAATCTSFLLFSYYRILKRHCCKLWGIIFSRTRGERQLLNNHNLDDPSLQFQSRGLDSYAMHSLPITQFRKKNGEEVIMNQSNTDCAVCLGEFEEGEWLKYLPNCSHAFHVSCIDTWFQSHSNCPLCRAHIYDLTMDHEYPVSVYTLLETLRREDFFQERSAQYQVLRSHALQSSSLNLENAH